MEKQLARKEIKFLDKLCGRWDNKVAESNLKLLQNFYKSTQSIYKNYGNFKAIDLEQLRNDLVGARKRFKNMWELINEANKIAEEENLSEVRFAHSSGTIFIIHQKGLEKWLVISIIRKGKSWTYKAYHNLLYLKRELLGREETSESLKVPYTKITTTGNRKGRYAFSKEEYGGVELRSLAGILEEEEHEKFWKIIDRFMERQEVVLTSNYTYNPATKKIYKVDVR